MYCPKCKKEYDGKFCPECGTKLIEKPAAKDGFNISLGDANAISGGVHLADSHAVHNEDKSIHNITNTTSTVNNITQVSAQKTEMELLQERKTLYLNACKRAYEDNVLEQSEKIELDRYRLELGLDEATADSLLEQVRQMTLRRAQKTELTGIGKIKLKQLTEALKKNEVQSIMRQIDSSEALAGKFANDELQYKYYLVLAALRHEKCIEKFEKSKVDNYWKSFWSYFAYLKAEKPGKASEVLYSLSDKFPSYPEDNITLLAAAGSFFKNEKEEAHEFLNEVTGDYSPALQRFAETVYLLLQPKMAKKMKTTKESCAFYLVNFFGQKDSKVKAEKEAKKKAEEEAKRKAEEKERRKAEVAAIRKAEKEAKRKAKEEEARKKAEEEARKKAEAAAKRKAEREAKKKAEEEARKEQQLLLDNLVKKMAFVKGGEFIMGTGRTSHRVKLSSFHICRNRVTQELWNIVMGGVPSNNLPMVNVSWYDCQNFIHKLSTITKRKFRLPTEAEWEYAATHKEGMNDMTGRIREGCNDWYSASISCYSDNPQGPSSGHFRVYRGGNYTSRYYGYPSYKSKNLGFRLAEDRKKKL